MTELNLDDLEAKAKAATPGPWEDVSELAPDLDRYSRSIYSEGYKGLLIGRISQNGAHDADAAFIATANPATVLALIARIRELEAREADVRDELKLAYENVANEQGNGIDAGLERAAAYLEQQAKELSVYRDQWPLRDENRRNATAIRALKGTRHE